MVMVLILKLRHIRNMHIRNVQTEPTASHTAIQTDTFFAGSDGFLKIQDVGAHLLGWVSFRTTQSVFFASSMALNIPGARL